MAMVPPLLALFVELVFIGIGSAAATPQYETEFEAWKLRYHKTYESAEDEQSHFEAFKVNYDEVQETNAKGLTYKVKLGQFADVSAEDFSQFLGGMRPANRSQQQGFLSKYITMVDKPAHQARSGFFTSARAEPLRNNMGFDTPKIIEQEEEKDMHKLLTDNDNMPTGLYAMGIALLTLVAFLGVRMRRAMNPTITLASNGAHVSNMSLPISPLSGDHNMELKAQGTAVRGQEEVLRQSSESATRKDSCKSLGWWPSSSQKSQPLTVCFAAPGDAPTSKQAMGDINDSGARGLAAVHRRQLLGGLATSLAAHREGRREIISRDIPKRLPGGHKKTTSIPCAVEHVGVVGSRNIVASAGLGRRRISVLTEGRIKARIPLEQDAISQIQKVNLLTQRSLLAVLHVLIAHDLLRRGIFVSGVHGSGHWDKSHNEPSLLHGMCDARHHLKGGGCRHDPALVLHLGLAFNWRCHPSDACGKLIWCRLTTDFIVPSADASALEATCIAVPFPIEVNPIKVATEDVASHLFEILDEIVELGVSPLLF